MVGPCKQRPSTMIELKNVTRRYLQGENVVLALDNVSLTIEQSQFVAVTGESGSGKSTLLHLLGDWIGRTMGRLW